MDFPHYFLSGIIAGLLASPHCAGMCGAFPLHLSRAPGKRSWQRQLLFAMGKTGTYAFLGALAGAAGDAILRQPLFSSVRHVLACLLGGLLIVFGLMMLGGLPEVRLPLEKANAGFLQNLFAPFFRSSSLGACLVLGAATGFLPCGITLAMLAVAAASHSVLSGMALMTGVGLGTGPVLIAIGLSGGLAQSRFRRIGLRGAGVVVIALGLLMLLRPLGLLHHSKSHGAPTARQIHGH